MKTRVVIPVLIAAVLLVSACGNKGTTTAPSASLPGKTLSVAMTTYSDSAFGFSIDYPIDWLKVTTVPNQFRASSQGIVPGNSIFGDNESGIVVTIDNSTYPSGLTLESYYQSFLTSAKQSLSIKSLTEQSVGKSEFGQKISGYSAIWLVTDTAGQWKLQWYFVNARNEFYVICVYSLQSAFENYTPIFDAAINSFTFIAISSSPAGTSSPLPTANKPTYTAAPPMTLDRTKQYLATMTTTYGDMVFQLFPADAPQTVNSFIFLIRQHYYDDTIFFRVVSNFFVQGGDPTLTGSGGPGYYTPDEFSSHKHIAGSLSMANAGSNTNGSQFFICYTAQPSLDGQFTVFGQLTQGTDVLYKIQQGDKLIKATVSEK